MVSSGDKRNMVAYLGKYYKVSISRACRTLLFAKSMYYYRSVKDDSEVIAKLLELAVSKPREGQDKYYQRLRLQGYSWNKKRIRRVYLMLGLNLRRKTKKRVPKRVKDYNNHRPHEALGGITPERYEKEFSSKQACLDEASMSSNKQS